MSKKKKAPQQSTKPYKEYLNYLNQYDTSDVDSTLGNLTDWASEASSNLADQFGNYNFNVTADDAARQRAEQATFDSYMNYMTPQFDRQRESYATMLQNQGIPVGSEAYERAMGDLQDRQNQAVTQASAQAVKAGQDAYSQSLTDDINASGFGNASQQAYINQLLSALQGSASGYENKSNIYAAGTAKSAVDYQNALAKAQASGGGLGGAISGALGGAAAMASTGNPYAIAGGALLGGIQGYRS